MIDFIQMYKNTVESVDLNISIFQKHLIVFRYIEKVN